jgi:glycogenin glucosyltransferase
MPYYILLTLHYYAVLHQCIFIQNISAKGRPLMRYISINIPWTLVIGSSLTIFEPHTTHSIPSNGYRRCKLKIHQLSHQMSARHSYVVGALVLAYSLRDSGTAYPIECIVSKEISSESIRVMKKIFNRVHSVDKLETNSPENIQLLGRPELGATITKIHVWNMIHLDKAIFLDADMLVLKNIDELFEREEFSACADIGWPDCFNSGLFVCRPLEKTFKDLYEHLQLHGSFDGNNAKKTLLIIMLVGGDQGLLNSFFSDWSKSDASHRIPFVYNMLLNATYNYVPAYMHFRQEVKAVHFIGVNKPWKVCQGKFQSLDNTHPSHLEFYQKWWQFHDKYILAEVSFHAIYISSVDRTTILYEALSFQGLSSGRRLRIWRRGIS